MARIRSIKPDFFTSEVVAGLPISARLSFIGLWTHVDDNGVCLDNDKLIAAAIWPLEDDPREALQRLREDLQSLHEVRLIVRYEACGKRYLFIRSWDEHQKVSHPKKPRFPRPTDEQISATASGNTKSPEIFMKPSGESPEDDGRAPEDFRPEQGAGSREQGTEQGYMSAPQAEQTSDSKADPADDPKWVEFWAAFPRRDGKQPALKAWAKAIKHANPDAIITGAKAYAAQQRRLATPREKIKMPQGWLNDRRWEDHAATDGRPDSGYTRATNGHTAAHPATKPRTAGRFADLDADVRAVAAQHREAW